MPKVMMAALLKGTAVLPALLKGFIPMPFHGHFDIAVTDVLINEEGIVEDVFYAQRTAADHLDFKTVRAFALRS